MLILRGAESDAHFKSHFAPGVQSTLHGPVQVTWQVDPGSQPTLPLAPTVTLHVASESQPMMHPSPQEPLQELFA
ncbi:hypothetical protein LZC95_02540 [Pendulispora brunnea]|uniref:Uncharacterized protein n=1 Tax=Pendulispora brunnea TaxID=2905690 RepID=A0ABZ2KC98_9BACT